MLAQKTAHVQCAMFDAGDVGGCGREGQVNAIEIRSIPAATIDVDNRTGGLRRQSLIEKSLHATQRIIQHLLELRRNYGYEPGQRSLAEERHLLRIWRRL